MHHKKFLIYYLRVTLVKRETRCIYQIVNRRTIALACAYAGPRNVIILVLLYMYI